MVAPLPKSARPERPPDPRWGHRGKALPALQSHRVGKAPGQGREVAPR